MTACGACGRRVVCAVRSGVGNARPAAAVLPGRPSAFSIPLGVPGMLDSSEVQVLCPSLVETKG